MMLLTVANQDLREWGVGERKTIISTDKLHGKTVWVLRHRGEKRYQIILVNFY